MGAAATRARVVGVGESPSADVRATEIRLDAAGRPTFTLVDGARGRRAVPLPCTVSTTSATPCRSPPSRSGGHGLREVAEALAGARPASRWRMEVTERADGVTVVNDAYNANPDSMRAALKALAPMGRGRRTWAVLGEMLELGDESITEHDAIGRLAVRLNISRLVVVGESARPMDSGAHQEGSWGEESVWVPDADAAHELLSRELDRR